MNALLTQIDAFITHIHFLRPQWLFGLLLLIPSLWWLKTARGGTRSGWEKVISPAFLAHLQRPQTGKRVRRGGLYLAPVFLLVLCLGLAGPSWRESPQPVYQRSDNLVVVLDLSLSMLATDLAPNRLTAAKRKLADLFQHRKEGQTALVVYAGSAFTVTPLTDDIRTLEAMLPALDPSIMPAPGSQPAQAIELALTLLQQSGATEGQVLLLTDEIEPKDIDAITEVLKESNVRLKVLGFGTATGAPIPLPRGGYLKDKETLIVPTFDLALAQKLARKASALAVAATLGDADLHALELLDDTRLDVERHTSEADTEDKIRLWQDDGVYLVFILLALWLLIWRKGASLWLAVVLILPQAPDALAFEWEDLWQTPDQQGQERYATDPAGAATRFTNPQWQGAAYFRAGDYEAAAQSFAAGNKTSAQTNYNQGTALAHAQKFEEALKALNEALALDPDHQDALHNKQLVEEILKQQQQQQSQDQQQSSQEDASADQNANDPSQSEDQGQGKRSSPQDQAADTGGQSKPSSPEKEPEDDKATSEENSSPESGNPPSTETPTTEAPESPAAPAEAPPEPANTPPGGPGESMADDAEIDQTTEQWLRRIPDDPGGLLRRKFALQYQERQSAQPAPAHKGEKKW